MTLREIDVALKCIHVRRHNDGAFQVALHGGKKIKPKTVHWGGDRITKTPDFNKKDDDAALNALKGAMMLKKSRFNPKYGVPKELGG